MTVGAIERRVSGHGPGRRMRRWTAVILALISAAGLAIGVAWVQPASAQEQAGSLTIQGRVVNGTEGGDPVEGLSVVFHQNSVDMLNESRTAAGPDGGFVFRDIIYDPDIAYGVSVIYKGALYGANLDLSQGEPGPVELAIYEPIRSDEVLSATLVSMLIETADPVSQTLSVLEIVRLVNASDLTYVPGPEPMQIVRFGLPAGTRDLRVDTSLLVADVFQVDRGFGVSASVPPGTHEVLYSYQFPYSGASHLFWRNLRYGADLLRIVIPSQVAGLADVSVGESGEIDIGGQPYNVLEVEGVPRGHDLGFTLTDLPVPGFGDRVVNFLRSVQWELAAPVALGVLAAAAVGYVLWRNRRSGRLPAPGRRAQPDERELVIAMVADLDRRRREDGMDEDEYRRRRAVLTRRLAGLAGGGAGPDPEG